MVFSFLMVYIYLFISFYSHEEAQASHVYSYVHGFKGIAAKLTYEKALEMASKYENILSNFPKLDFVFFSLELKYTGMPGVVSVFPNLKRNLHTTHSWDYMGTLNDEAMEVPGYSTKNQENIIIGFIDTVNKSYYTF